MLLNKIEFKGLKVSLSVADSVNDDIFGNMERCSSCGVKLDELYNNPFNQTWVMRLKENSRLRFVNNLPMSIKVNDKLTDFPNTTLIITQFNYTHDYINSISEIVSSFPNRFISDDETINKEFLKVFRYLLTHVGTFKYNIGDVLRLRMVIEVPDDLVIKLGAVYTPFGILTDTLSNSTDLTKGIGHDNIVLTTSDTDIVNVSLVNLKTFERLPVNKSIKLNTESSDKLTLKLRLGNNIYSITETLDNGINNIKILGEKFNLVIDYGDTKEEIKEKTKEEDNEESKEEKIFKSRNKYNILTRDELDALVKGETDILSLIANRNVEAVKLMNQIMKTETSNITLSKEELSVMKDFFKYFIPE